MWKLLERPKAVTVTQNLAKKFAEMTPCPHDRPVRPSITKMLEEECASGRFRTATWASAICDGVEYRINGKHTSTVLAGLEGGLPEAVVLVEKYQCDSIEDIAKLYATFDRSESARNTRDINTVFAASVPELNGISNQVIDVCVSGIAYAKWEGQYTSHPKHERAALILENAHFILFINGLLGSSKSNKFLLRLAVIAAIYRGYCKSRQAATEFWTEVRDGTNPSPSAPSRVLQRYLMTTYVNLGNGSMMGRRRDEPRSFYIRSLHAWNAYRRGDKSITILKYNKGTKTPAVS